MSDYNMVSAELDRGTPADVLCATCPWDRLCVQPPSITRTEIQQQIEEASRKPIDGEKGSMAALMTTIMLAGKDTTAQVCPVFALRLSGLDGRGIADRIRAQMRSWGTSQDGEAAQ